MQQARSIRAESEAGAKSGSKLRVLFASDQTSQRFNLAVNGRQSRLQVFANVLSRRLRCLLN
jgi:hypothetical protein